MFVFLFNIVLVFPPCGKVYCAMGRLVCSILQILWLIWDQTCHLTEILNSTEMVNIC